jgi:hypothetical protein
MIRCTTLSGSGVPLGKNILRRAKLSAAQIAIPHCRVGIEKSQNQIQPQVLVKIKRKHAGALLNAHFEQMRGEIAIPVIFKPKKQGVLVDGRGAVGGKKIYVAVAVEVAAGHFAALQNEGAGNRLGRAEGVVAQIFAPADAVAYGQSQVLQPVAVQICAKTLAAQAFEPAFFGVLSAAQVFDEPGVVDQNIVVAVALNI